MHTSVCERRGWERGTHTGRAQLSDPSTCTAQGLKALLPPDVHRPFTAALDPLKACASQTHGSSDTCAHDSRRAAPLHIFFPHGIVLLQRFCCNLHSELLLLFGIAPQCSQAAGISSTLHAAAGQVA